ncbi:hypothetical protein DRO61_11670 [Candidatus Bathyarchaeota archaeon]|nr:MAG: hypothetical protein DRO61_11670 [Candidatus Bathyarchaeota archaeon]
MQERMDALGNKMYSQGAKKTQEEYEAKMTELKRLKELEAMSEKERFDAERKDFETTKQGYTKDRARFNALQQLSDEGLNKDFVDFVADTDNDKMMSNVKALKELIASQVSTGIKSGLAGSPKQIIANSKPAETTDNGWDAGTNKNLRH